MKGPSIRELARASAVTSVLLTTVPGYAQVAYPEGEKVELSPDGTVKVPGDDTGHGAEPADERVPEQDRRLPSSDPPRPPTTRPQATPPQATPSPVTAPSATPPQTTQRVSAAPAPLAKASGEPTAPETDIVLSPGARAVLRGLWAGSGLGFVRASSANQAEFALASAYYKTFGRIVGVGLLTEAGSSNSVYVMPTLHLGRQTFGDVGVGAISTNGELNALLGAGLGHHFFIASPGFGRLTMTPRLVVGVAGDQGSLFSLSVSIGYWFYD